MILFLREPLAFKFYGFHKHLRRAFPVKTELPGGPGAQVDDPASDEGAAIVDPHDDLPVVFQIGDTHEGRQGQMFVGGAQAAGIEGFAVGGHATAFLTVGFKAVPGRDTGLTIGPGFFYAHGNVAPAPDPVRRCLYPPFGDGFFWGKSIDGFDIVVGQGPCQRGHHHGEGEFPHGVNGFSGEPGDLVAQFQGTGGDVVGGFGDAAREQAQTDNDGDAPQY